MKILESQASYKLSIELTDEERLEFYKAFLEQAPIVIPMFGNKEYQILEMSSYHWEGAPKNSYYLLVNQLVADRQST